MPAELGPLRVSTCCLGPRRCSQRCEGQRLAVETEKQTFYSSSVFPFLLLSAEANCHLPCRSPVSHSSDTWMSMFTCCQHTGAAGKGEGITKKKSSEEHVLVCPHPPAWRSVTAGGFQPLCFTAPSSDRRELMSLTWLFASQ